MTVELWTLDGTDEEHAEVIDLFRMALGLAEEAGVASPETVSSLRSWCNAEWTRINPRAPQVPPEQELLASLRRSPYWVFWEGLEKDEEVRWTGTKTATYFVVDPTPSFTVPGSDYSRHGVFIELRRHSGKTFWSHIAKVRPL